jgi:hypothetical protein
MTKYINKIHNIATGEITEIPFTPEEIAFYEASNANDKKLEIMKIILSIIFINISILSYCQETVKDSIYNAVDLDVKPDFPGGIEKFMKFMVKNFKVPEVSNFKGKVISEFIVEKVPEIPEGVIFCNVNPVTVF